MQVILLDKIPNLGNLGKQVNVKPGYARNFLIPQGKAVQATKKNIEYFETQRSNLAIQLSNIYIEAKNRIEELNKLGIITIKSKAGKEGKLFGSIGARDIANAINSNGINITKKEVHLVNGVLRSIGEHKVIIQVHREMSTTLRVVITTN